MDVTLAALASHAAAEPLLLLFFNSLSAKEVHRVTHEKICTVLLLKLNGEPFVFLYKALKR